MYKKSFKILANIFFNSFVLNMITFQGRQQALKNADMIGRKVSGTYPHISGSKLCLRYCDAHHIQKNSLQPLPKFIEKVVVTINKYRSKINHSRYYYSAMVNEVKKKKVGNCFEDAMLAELIGHINGQDNIHIGNLFVKKQRVKKTKALDHAVAFITDKNINNNNEYKFKNKEAIIIDPWLNIVDFAGNYFTKLKNQYRNCFDNLPNQDFLEYLVSQDSKNVKEFRQNKKNSCQHLAFSIRPAHSICWDKEREDYYKSCFPELFINNYEKIVLTQNKKVKRK